jgi:hypothetical protein
VRTGRPTTAPAALALALGLAFPIPAAGAAAPPTIAPEELRPGDRAVVRTVFRGDSIEEFPAEIVGVLGGGRVDGQVIVARGLGERLERLGVAQGMSGSPVYVDGRLAGALASSWPYQREPLFGITPIREMLRLSELPEGPEHGPTAGPAGADLPVPAPDAEFRGLHWGPGVPRATGPARPDAPAPGGPAPLPVPLACDGLAPAALDLARERLAPLGLRVAPGGAALPAAGETSVEPGSAVAVDLMRGDLQLSAIGTVTWREGDRVLLFGHPLFQAGAVRLPLSTARIVTVVGSDHTSFKLGARGREVGVVGQDRRAGLAGTLGPRARLLPMTVRIEGLRPAPQRFRFEMVEDRALAPALAGIAALNSLLEAGGTAPGQTFAWTLRLHRGGADPLVLTDVAAGDTPAGDLANAVSGPLAFLFANPFAPLALDSVDLAVRATPGRAQWTLRRARLLGAAARPGGTVRVACDLERWRGGAETRVLEVRVPEELAAGTYRVWVGGGTELTRVEAARAPARYRPTSLDDAWRRFAALRRGTGLHAAILAGSADVTAAGLDYAGLPRSADALLASGLTATGADRRADEALVGEVRTEFPGVVRGELQLSLTVDRKAP